MEQFKERIQHYKQKNPSCMDMLSLYEKILEAQESFRDRTTVKPAAINERLQREMKHTAWIYVTSANDTSRPLIRAISIMIRIRRWKISLHCILICWRHRGDSRGLHLLSAGI